MDTQATSLNHAGLGSLHQNGSPFSVEGQRTQGAQNIINRVTLLPSQQCQHHIGTVASCPAGGMQVFVGANLQLGEQHALKFGQAYTNTRGGERATDKEALVKDFINHYFNTFYRDRAALRLLYQDGSMFTYEGQKIQGVQNIVNKLTSLPFIQHNISTIDCQPSGPGGGMLVFVSGTLLQLGEQRALKFSQTFHLTPAAGSFYGFYGFYILNDIFQWN